MPPDDSAELREAIAALRATTESELRNLNARLEHVEATQAELVRVATTGKAGLRTLLWVGGLITAGLSALAAAWGVFAGR